MSDRLEQRWARDRIEHDQKWEAEIDLIPFINFPADWAIQVIPPFRDAVVRFRVRLPSGTFKSVYLDSRMSLGYWEGPYWEVYPYEDDIGRCDRDDIDTLLRMIAEDSK